MKIKKKKKKSYKGILAFGAIQIKGNRGFERAFGSHLLGEGLLLYLEILFCDMHV